jgi:uncharacterized protein
MTIAHETFDHKGLFLIRKDNETIAQMTYVWAGENRIIIDHTEVDESLKGQNVGKKLLNELVAFARERSIKVMPLCPFAKAMMEKTSDYNDVLF